MYIQFNDKTNFQILIHDIRGSREPVIYGDENSSNMTRTLSLYIGVGCREHKLEYSDKATVVKDYETLTQHLNVRNILTVSTAELRAADKEKVINARGTKTFPLKQPEKKEGEDEKCS